MDNINMTSSKQPSFLTLTEIDGTPLTVNFNIVAGLTPVLYQRVDPSGGLDRAIDKFNQNRGDKPKLKTYVSYSCYDETIYGVKEDKWFGKSADIPESLEGWINLYIPGTQLDLGNRQVTVLQSMEEITEALQAGTKSLHQVGLKRVGQIPEQLDGMFMNFLQANFK